MSEATVTQLLQRWSAGDREAMTRVVPLLYEELRRIAQREMRREKGPRTLQATALVHEAYLRLQEQMGQHWTSRSHFFAFSAHLIRRILIDEARLRHRLKLGEGLERETLAGVEELALPRPPDLVALDDALKSLEAVDPFKASIVELRYFGGLTREEAATALGVSPETVGRHWRQAKAWLYRELSPRDGALIAGERWQEVDRLFGLLLELDGAERGAVLGFHFEEQDRDRGLRLGPYKLIERLHSGGMGTVYRARRADEHFEQPVAIKILRAGLEGTEALLRFRAERQILARLQHPNIARLYDGGSTPDGRPFLVMELVEGVPIDGFCERVRATVEERLTLLRKVCAAVHYAHQNLLVHRDLKPDNILVTPEGEPMLLDFGIAKQLAPAGERGGPELTETGLRLMTPSYASPEQVRGEPITTASDVYSLGVLLYRLLSGRTPYRTAGGLQHEVERAICEAEPERPSEAVSRPADGGEDATPETIAAARRLRPAALRRRLAGDLDNIALMALRKEPARRYASVEQLASDLESHRLSLPVLARPDSSLYVARKFLRRHRVGVALAASVCLIVLGLLVGLAFQGRRLVRERDKARSALSFLIDMFKGADPYKTGGEHLSARQILSRGAERVRRDLARQPEVQASLMDAIGQVDLGLGRVEEAEPLLAQALALRRRVLGADSLETLDSLDHLALAKFERSDLAGAERLLRQSLAAKRRSLSARNPALAPTLTALGDLLASEGAARAPEAAALYGEALAIQRQAEGESGAGVAKTLILQGRLENLLGHYERAEELYRAGLTIEGRRSGVGDPAYLYDLANLSEILHDAGKDREAEGVLRGVIGRQEKALGRDHPDLAFTLNNLALLLHSQARYPEAEVLYRQALELQRSLYGSSTLRVAALLNNLAATVQAQGRTREAIPLHEECLAVRRRLLGGESQEVAQSILFLAQAHSDVGEYDQAVTLGKQSLAILRRVLGPRHPLVGYPLREIGRALVWAWRPAEAEPYLRECLEIRRKTLAPTSPEIGKAEVTLGACLVDLRRFAEAEPLLRQGLDRLSGTLPPDDKRVADARLELARLYRAWGRPDPGVQATPVAPLAASKPKAGHGLARQLVDAEKAWKNLSRCVPFGEIGSGLLLHRARER